MFEPSDFVLIIYLFALRLVAMSTTSLAPHGVLKSPDIALTQVHVTPAMFQALRRKPHPGITPQAIDERKREVGEKNVGRRGKVIALGTSAREPLKKRSKVADGLGLKEEKLSDTRNLIATGGSVKRNEALGLGLEREHVSDVDQTDGSTGGRTKPGKRPAACRGTRKQKKLCDPQEEMVASELASGLSQDVFLQSSDPSHAQIQADISKSEHLGSLDHSTSSWRLCGLDEVSEQLAKEAIVIRDSESRQEPFKGINGQELAKYLLQVSDGRGQDAVSKLASPSHRRKQLPARKPKTLALEQANVARSCGVTVITGVDEPTTEVRTERQSHVRDMSPELFGSSSSSEDASETMVAPLPKRKPGRPRKERAKQSRGRRKDEQPQPKLNVGTPKKRRRVDDQREGKQVGRLRKKQATVKVPPCGVHVHVPTLYTTY